MKHGFPRSIFRMTIMTSINKIRSKLGTFLLRRTFLIWSVISCTRMRIANFWSRESPARQVKSNTHFSRYTDLEPISEIFHNLGHFIFLSNLSVLLRKLGNLLLLCLKSRLYLPINRIAANDQKLPMRMRVHEITLQIRNVLLKRNVLLI